MKECLTCGRILAMMVISGFMLHHMLRVNMSIAIVDMVAQNGTSGSKVHFDWGEEEKNEILGCFYWGFAFSPILGGRLAETYGTKKVLGGILLVGSLFTLLTPLAASIDYYFIIASRIILGFALGLAYPAILPMAVRWVPPTDISKFISHSSASSLGGALTLPICGFLISHLGWPSVFYVTGSVTLVWVILWFYLVYDSPRDHPRISNHEKATLITQIKNFEPQQIPWIQILKSKPIWAVAAAYTSVITNLNFITNYSSIYLSDVLDFNIEHNGLLSSLPHLSRYCSALLFACIGDKLQKNQTFTTITLRRVFTTIALAGPVLLFVTLFFWGSNQIFTIVAFFLWMLLTGAATPGITANIIDIAPAFSGTVCGICVLGVTTITYVSTRVVTWTTKDKQDFEHWKYVFLFYVVINLSALLVFLVFAEAKAQKWNSSRDDDAEKRLRKS